MKEELIGMIRTREANVAVIGLGRVGLLTAAVFADAGFKVKGVDLKKEVVETVSSGKSHIKEPGLNELVEKVVREGRLNATTDALLAVRKAEVTIICVQTPITKNKQPNNTYLKKASKDVAKALSKGKLMVVQSTVPPGTTRLVAETLEEESGLKCGRDFWLVHCPERIAPGKALREFVETTRIVGGYDQDSVEIAVELFKTVTKGEIVTTDCTSAEIAKLSENAFRDVNVAFANELALICEQTGVDVMEVMKLANTHPRVNIHMPGCGVGGPCLPKDPYLLLHSVKEKNFRSKVMKPSRELNDYMPRHMVELVLKALKKAEKDVRNSKIAVLGTAYKADVDDATNSPAKRIVHELMNLGAEVVVYDPYCEESFGAEKGKDLTEAIKMADCVVIATDHKAFKQLKLEKIKSLTKKNSAIVDGRRIIEPEEAKRSGLIYFGIGYGLK